MTELTRHLAAVMFTDVVGYTAIIAEDKKAGLAARKRHRDALETAIAHSNGRLIQYFGDGSLSIFPSAVVGVTAAIAVQRHLHSAPSLPVRIGLHVGDIAYDEQGAYGDAVNIASRIESLAVPGGILISRKVVDEIRNHPELPTVRLGTVELKNVRDPVEVYAIYTEGVEVPRPTELAREGDGSAAEHASPLPESLRAHLDRMQPRLVYRERGTGAFPRTLPFVGRAAEMDALRTLLETTQSGRGGTALICGDRGVGKSRLAEAVAQQARERGWLVALGRAYPAERLVSFAPLSDALVPILRGIDATTLQALIGDENLIYNLFPALGPSSPSLGLRYADPTELQARLFDRLTALLIRLAEHQPILIILEDLQWSDESSIEFLHFVARQTADEPIFFICQYSEHYLAHDHPLRTVEQSLLRINVATRFQLDPLTMRQTEDLVREAFEAKDPAVSQFASKLFHWTGGNPLFLEGTLRALVETRHLFQEDGAWRGWQVEEFDVPRSVRDHLLALAGELSPTARQVADLASVIGVRSSHDVLESVCQLNEDQLGEALDELQRAQILAEVDLDRAIGYDFCHPLIRETLQFHLSATRRRALHGHVAHALERFYADRATAHAAELAHHFARAHRRRAGAKAVLYLALAGKDALSRQANPEAVKHLRAALDQIDGTGWKAGSEGFDQLIDFDTDDIVKALARAETRLGNYEASIDLWRRALAGAHTRDDSRQLAGIHREIGLALFWDARLEEAQDEFQEGLRVARAIGEDLMVASIDLSSSLCYQHVGRQQEARQAAEESLSLGEKHGNVPLLARAHISMARLHLWLGEPDAAKIHSEKALELATECGDPGVVYWSHWATGVMEGMRGNTREIALRIEAMNQIVDDVRSPTLKLWTAELSIEHAYCYGDWDAGMELGESAVDLARSLNQKTLLPRLLVWLSLIYIGRGDFDRVKELTDEAWEVSGADLAADHSGFIDVHTVVPAHIGRAAYHLGVEEWQEAIRVGEAGLAIAERTGYAMWSIHRLLPLVGEAYLQSRNLEQAKRISERLRSLSAPLGHPLGLAWADALDSIIAWLEGDSERGADLLRKAADLLDAFPMRLDATRLRRQLAGRLAEIGDRDGALPELRSVHATFAWLGCAGELQKTRVQFGELNAEPPPLVHTDSRGGAWLVAEDGSAAAQ